MSSAHAYVFRKGLYPLRGYIGLGLWAGLPLGGLPTRACPADLPSGIAHHQCVVGNISDDHDAGLYEGVSADGHAADDSAVGSQGGSGLHQGGPHLVHLTNGGPWVVDVRNDHGRPARHIVLQGDSLVHRHGVLNATASADGDIGPDDLVLADVVALPSDCSGKTTGKMPGVRLPAYMHHVAQTA